MKQQTDNIDLSNSLFPLLNKKVSNVRLLPKPIQSAIEILGNKSVSYLEAVLATLIIEAIQGNINASKLLVGIISDQSNNAQQGGSENA